MSSYMDNYEKIYAKIKAMRANIIELQGHIADIAKRRDDELPVKIENLEALLVKIDEYELKIDGFMKLAEKHLISKNVPTVEAPEGYRVNLNRLKRWSMLIDPMADDDAYAQRVYVVAKCDLCFLGKKKVEFSKRVEELKADLANGSTDEIKECEKKIEETLNSLKAYLVSSELIDFSDMVRVANEEYMNLVYPKVYSNVSTPKSGYIPGSKGYELDPGTEYRVMLKDIIGDYYDQSLGKVFLPGEVIAADSEFVMTINCVPARARLTEMDAGIRNIIFDFIDKNPAGTGKVYVVDGVRMNSSVVGSLKNIEDTFALASVPRNPEQAETLLEEIISSFTETDEILDGETYDTVSAYNKDHGDKEKLTRSLMVMVGWQNAFDSKSKEYINRIITNYERYGISLILVTICGEEQAKKLDKDGNGLSDYVGENIIRIDMRASGDTIRIGKGEAEAFKWYQFKQVISTEYADSLKAHTVLSNFLGNEYPKRVDLSKPVAYTRGKKNLSLPYGVDTKDSVHSIGFDNENFAAYLMGASGSGKSTLLHNIVTGILRDYHPDDVELWLADFKMSEFAQYMDPLPPHVKYILLDESPELVYDLIDRLTEKMMERQRFFMQHKEMKKVENVPSNIYMPVIFVILDEFSIMSQAVADSEVYKLKLQNILAKGRALGIKFIFSSQTFTKGIAGLTQTAKEQIQTRIAMKNSTEEINATLELSTNTRTDQVRNWIDALPAHYALLKYREGEAMKVKRLQVLYFPGAGDEALEPQRKLIRGIKDSFIPVSEDKYAASLNTYVDKKPVLVDGNSYSGYNREFLEKQRDAYIEELGKDYAGDILISPGDPRRMAAVKFMSISEESRENLLLVSRNAEQACAMSILLSSMKEFTEQGGNAHVWAYARNRLYHAYKSSGFEGFECADTIEEICTAIKVLKAKIENREAGRDLYILLGMEQICADFSTIDFSVKSGSKPTVVLSTPMDNAKLMASTEEEQKEVEAMKEETADLDAALDAMFEEKLELGWSMEDILAEQERMTAEFVEKQKQAIDAEASGGKKSSKKTKAKAEEATPKKEEVAAPAETIEEEPVAYNAMQDFKYVVTQGSRVGYHFLMVINNIKDLKQTGLNVSLFNHKLAFQLSADDSIELFSSRAAASKLPEHICEYSNSLDSFSFRPYLHKDVEWDGWSVDEKGTAVRPGAI